MQDHTWETIIIVGGFIAFAVMFLRHHMRKEFKAECREKRIRRLTEQTGWPDLDAINWELYVAYRRLENHG